LIHLREFWPLTFYFPIYKSKRALEEIEVRLAFPVAFPFLKFQCETVFFVLQDRSIDHAFSGSEFFINYKGKQMAHKSFLIDKRFSKKDN
jgi:hypothetical protein